MDSVASCFSCAKHILPACFASHLERKKKRMDRNDRHSFLTKVGFGALTCNSLLAIYRSKGDLASVAFVVGAYAALLLLFFFLGKFERARPEERGKNRAGGNFSIIVGFGSSRPSFFPLGRTSSDDGEVAPMRPRGGRVIATGFTIVIFSVSAGISLSGYVLLLCLLGFLVGVTLITVGVRMTDDLTTVCSTTFPSIGLMPVLLSPSLAVVGLIVASSAVTVATGETSPALCFSLFAMFLVGIFLIMDGVRGA